MEKQINKAHLLSLWTNILVFLTISVLLLSKKAYVIPLGLLAITAFFYFGYQVFLIRYTGSNFKKTIHEHTYIFGVFLLYSFLFIFFYFYRTESASFLDKPMKLFIFCFILFLLIHFPPRLNVLLTAINIAAIIAGCVAIYQIYYLSMDRAFQNMIAIQGGDIAMSLGLFSAMIYLYFHQVDKKTAMLVSLLAAVLGIIASFLSGSRGGWICLPPLLVFFLFSYRHKITLKGIILGVSALGLIAVFFVSNPKLSNVFSRTYHNISLYYDGEGKNTSVGYRIELWKSALYSWQEKPILGWGERNIAIARKQQGEEGKVSSELYKTDFHAHNQFLEELSVRGVLGFIVFVCLLLTPLLIFYKAAKEQKQNGRLVGYLGVLHIYLISTYCLTQAFFAHNSGVIFYALMTVVFYSVLRNIKTSENNQ